MPDFPDPSVAIQVKKLSKRFDLSLKQNDRFRDMVVNGIGRMFRPENEAQRYFQALSNISFTLKKGEVLGIIGDNGAGKSTLLKLLGEVTTPTTGEILLAGRVASILEVGTGFHPELSGRENIFLSGQVLGMSKEEIEAKFQQIVDFSGIGKFIHVPVKRYSSGMFIRLAFSVVSHLDSDIVLLDEVLSVGDAEFKVKSLNKIRELARSGKTVVLVSHDLNSVAGLCTRCLVLEQGKMKAYGSPKEITGAYIERTLMEMDEPEREQSEAVPEEKPAVAEAMDASGEKDAETLTEAYLKEADELQNTRLVPERSWSDLKEAPGDERMRVRAVRLFDAKGHPKSTFRHDEAIHLKLDYEKFDAAPSSIAWVILYQLSVPAFFCNPMFREQKDRVPFDRAAGKYTAEVVLPPDLLNSGIYSLDLYVVGPGVEEWFSAPRLLNFKVELGPEAPDQYNYSGGFPGPMYPRLHWELKVSEGGADD